MPDGNWGAPISFARDGPVHVVAQPLAKASFFDVIGVPIDLGVPFDQLVFQRRSPNVPGTLGVVEQRGVTPPAEWIGVTIDIIVEQQASLREVLYHLFVGVFHELSGEGVVASDDSLQIHRLHKSQLFFSTNSQIFVAKGWRNMYDASTVL